MSVTIIGLRGFYLCGAWFMSEEDTRKEEPTAGAESGSAKVEGADESITGEPPESHSEADTAEEAADEDGDSDGEDEAGGGDSPDGADADDEEAAFDAERFAESLNRWFTQVTRDCSAALSKTAEITILEVSVADADTLQAAVEAAPVAQRAVARAGSLEVPLAMLAAEDAAIALARAALGDDETSELDEKAMTAFGELGRQVWGSLEGAWLGEGAEGVVIEPSEPERIEEAGPGFEAGRVALGQAAALIEGAGEVELTFLFSCDVEGLFPAAEQNVEESAAPIADVPGIGRILRIRVPLVVEIASRMSKVAEVVDFKPGTVIEFDKRSDDLLELYAAKAHIGRGEAVKVGESFGIRVLEIDTPRERIKNLGG